MKLLYTILWIAGAAVSQTVFPSSCPSCVTVDPLGQGQDDLAGNYQFLAPDSDCPDGCSYTRSGLSYCFGPGPRTGSLGCSIESSPPPGPVTPASDSGSGSGSSSDSNSGSDSDSSSSSSNISSGNDSGNVNESGVGSSSGSGSSSGIGSSSDIGSGSGSSSGIGSSSDIGSGSGSSSGSINDSGSGNYIGSVSSSSSSSPSIIGISSGSSSGSSSSSDSGGSSFSNSGSGSISGSGSGSGSGSTSSQAPTTPSKAPTTPSCGYSGLLSCPPGWKQSGLKCYSLQVPPAPLPNWSKAKADCEKLWTGSAAKAHMASVESQCEQDFVKTLAAKKITWLGATDSDVEGTWKWSKPGGQTFWTGGNPTAGGKAVPGKFTGWMSTQPDSAGTQEQDCLLLQDDGEWNDQLCSKTAQYMCETPAIQGGAELVVPTTPKPVVAACSSTCESGWVDAGDCLCYKLQTTKATWAIAKAACNTAKTGASLISITSKEIETKVQTMLGTPEDYWTGGNDAANNAIEFRWDFGNVLFWKRDPAKEASCCAESGQYSNWYETAVKQPNHGNNQDCVKMKFKLSSAGLVEKAGWDDVNCNNTPLKSVCQYSIK